MKKTLITFIVGAALTCAASAQVTVTWSQSGDNMVASVTGSFATAGLGLFDGAFVDKALADNRRLYNNVGGEGTYFRVDGGDYPRFMTTDIGLADAQTGEFGISFTMQDDGDHFYLVKDGILATDTIVSLNGTLIWNNKNIGDYGINNHVYTLPTGQTITSGVAVPEPSSTALLGLGALGLLIRRKR